MQSFSQTMERLLDAPERVSDGTITLRMTKME